MSHDALRARVQEILAAAASKRTNGCRSTPMREPRYDETFFAGTAWMEAMDGNGPIATADLLRFRADLEERLLDLATGTEGLLPQPAFERWQREGHLYHLRDNPAVRGAFAAAYQDTIRPLADETYLALQELFLL